MLRYTLPKSQNGNNPKDEARSNLAVRPPTAILIKPSLPHPLPPLALRGWLGSPTSRNHIDTDTTSPATGTTAQYIFVAVGDHNRSRGATNLDSTKSLAFLLPDHNPFFLTYKQTRGLSSVRWHDVSQTGSSFPLPHLSFFVFPLHPCLSLRNEHLSLAHAPCLMCALSGLFTNPHHVLGNRDMGRRPGAV